MAPRLTIRQVAEEAGVSVATVSYVLNPPKEKVSISPATRKRVREAAERLRYRPDYFARSLRTKQSKVVGVLVDDLQSPYVNAMLDCASLVCRNASHEMLLGNLRDCAAPLQLCWQTFGGGRTRGILIADPRAILSDDDIRSVAEDIHVALLERRVPGLAVPTVVVDHIGGGYQGARALLAAGCGNIVAVHAHTDAHAGQKLAGIAKAFGERGRSFGPDWCIEVRPKSGHGMAEAALRAVTERLAGSGPVDGVFALSDELALGAMRAIHERGLTIPGDVAVMGYGDMVNVPAFCTPSLSTVRVPVYGASAKAAEALLDTIENGAPEGGSPVVVLPCGLKVRESGGRMPVS